MAVQIPDTLYTGGNVKFDSTPTVQFYRQIQAEQKAKQDAIDDYMRSLRGKVTTAGMRTQDIPAFDKKFKEWQQFGVMNREQMAKNPQLRAQFDAMAQDLVTFSNESKAEEEAKKPFIGMLTDPEKRKRLRPEVFAMIEEHDRPLYATDETGALVRDYGRKKLDYNSPLFKDPEFDFQKEYKTWSGETKPSEFIEFNAPYTDKQTGLVFFPAKEKFSKEQISQIGRNAIRSIADDEDKLGYYSTRLATIGQKDYEKLDEAYKKYFNDYIGKSPEKLAAAEAVAIAEQSVRDLKPVSKSDYERRQEDKRINISLNQGRGGGTTQVSDVNELYSRIGRSVDEAAKRQTWRPSVPSTLKKAALVQDLPFDESNLVVDFVNKSYPNKGKDDMPYKANELYLLRGADNKIRVYSSNENLLGILPEIATNLKVQPDVKTKRTVVERGEKAKSTTQTQTFIFPGGKTKF